METEHDTMRTYFRFSRDRASSFRCVPSPQKRGKVIHLQCGRGAFVARKGCYPFRRQPSVMHSNGQCCSNSSIAIVRLRGGPEEEIGYCTLWGCFGYIFPYIRHIHTAYIGEDSSKFLGTLNFWVYHVPAPWGRTFGCTCYAKPPMFCRSPASF